jgi:hypothetical protein
MSRLYISSVVTVPTELLPARDYECHICGTYNGKENTEQFEGPAWPELVSTLCFLTDEITKNTQSFVINNEKFNLCFCI